MKRSLERTGSVLRVLLLQFLLLLLIYQVSRLVFTLLNLSHFKGLTFSYYLHLVAGSFRYDISAVLATNALYFLLMLLPTPEAIWWERVKQIFFIVTNAFCWLFEFSDWAYFPFNFKRSTSDVLHMVGRKSDFFNLLPGFLKDYWYVPVAWVLVVVLFIWFNKRITRKRSVRPYSIKGVLFRMLAIAMMAGVCIVGIRGGFQRIPIGIRNAVQVTDSKYVPIVLNTPFSIMTSYATPAIEEVHYFPEAELKNYFNPIRNYSGKTFTPKNVVIVIVESLSKEFTSLGATGVSYTPFLNSLMQHSLVCTHAYANGSTSADGIPAILASMPALMDESFTTSNYGADKITSLPNVLKQKGYTSAFFHGGSNGTMSFDVFTAAAGFDQYFGRKEYHNDKDYDGNWGIWDEPFLHYTAQQLGMMKQPFMASVFTLTSHPPYHLPKGFENRFPKGTMEEHQCIGYTDYALRRFFETAARQAWYNNTLFVITADHCSPENGGGRYAEGMGRYAIPIIFYAPGDTALQGRIDTVTQQLDILPGVLDYLGYDHPFFSFGSSIFRSGDHFAMNRSNGQYQWMMGDKLLQTIEVNPKAFYQLSNDSIRSANLLEQNGAEVSQYLLKLKAFIQTYRSGLIHNQLSVNE